MPRSAGLQGTNFKTQSKGPLKPGTCTMERFHNYKRSPSLPSAFPVRVRTKKPFLYCFFVPVYKLPFQ
ncbi:hypothetical protein A3860_17245 [Niastella vici]|uniref:Uncharacterized protein n=1 Tax=Niastella vici TaxID=1703345 RepID=A0A1V9G4C3_9BACT|nr:hypothetical protein A3860_17245 [Niastella vici]